MSAGYNHSRPVVWLITDQTSSRIVFTTDEEILKSARKQSGLEFHRWDTAECGTMTIRLSGIGEEMPITLEIEEYTRNIQ